MQEKLENKLFQKSGITTLKIMNNFKSLNIKIFRKRFLSEIFRIPFLKFCIIFFFQAMTPPPENPTNEEDKNKVLQYEKWLGDQESAINQHLKYYETEISKLRKLRKVKILTCLPKKLQTKCFY